MQLGTVERAAAWAKTIPEDEAVEITFHGGEPLQAGKAFYRAALPLLRQARSEGLFFSMQSNLWRLDDEFADMLSEYGVGIGTSLDGPEAITDRQRGKGYFRRTMKGIETARRRGMKVGCIATLTRWSASHRREILDFLRQEGLEASIHAALPVLGGESEPDWALTAEDYGEVLVSALDILLEQDAGSGWKIEPVESICKGLRAGRGGTCIFGGCLGKHLAVGVEGDVYPCQRFVGMEAYRMGEIGADGCLTQAQSSATWQRLAERENAVGEECGDCAFATYCKGGCVYNALARGGTGRDPYCAAYRRIFGEIVERGVREFFSPQNLGEVVERVDERRGLLRKGRLIERMGEKP